MAKQEENWYANYEALKAHVAQTGHFPNKHCQLNNWVKYQRLPPVAVRIPAVDEKNRHPMQPTGSPIRLTHRKQQKNSVTI